MTTEARGRQSWPALRLLHLLALLAVAICGPGVFERGEAQGRAVSAADNWPDQSTQPVRFLGKVVTREHPLWRRYAKPIARYPGPRDCLLPGQSERPHPDLRAFDWQGPRRLSDLDVCLFRVFAALRSPDEVSVWLQHFGFQVAIFRDLGRLSEVPTDQNPIEGIGAQADQETYRSLRPSVLATLIGLDTVRSFSIDVAYDDDLQLVSVITFVRVE